MEYNLDLQSICSKSVQDKLNKIQNEAVRFIAGGMRSTSIEACEIDKILNLWTYAEMLQP